MPFRSYTISDNPNTIRAVCGHLRALARLHRDLARDMAGTADDWHTGDGAALHAAIADAIDQYVADLNGEARPASPTAA